MSQCFHPDRTGPSPKDNKNSKMLLSLLYDVGVALNAHTMHSAICVVRSYENCNKKSALVSAAIVKHLMNQVVGKNLQL